MNRDKAKQLFKTDLDSYGKPKHIMRNIDKIYDEFEKESFNLNEVRHLAINYAITCMKGYTGSFDDWFTNIDNWKAIANRK